MMFEDKSNPYFGGGKKTMQEWVKEDIKDMKKDLLKKNREDEPYCLGIDKITTYRLAIAFGGPNMFIEVDTQNNEIIGGRYIYSWYSTPEAVEIDENDAQIIADYYNIIIE